jgi:hypothetical protein
MQDIGVAGMVRTAAWCEHVVGAEAVYIGRPALAKEDCILELCGTSLFFRIALRGNWIWISVGTLDEDQPEFLFNVADGSEGWTTARRFVAVLERSGLKSVQPRPIRVGAATGPDSWVIS